MSGVEHILVRNAARRGWSAKDRRCRLFHDSGKRLESLHDHSHTKRQRRRQIQEFNATGRLSETLLNHPHQCPESLQSTFSSYKAAVHAYAAEHGRRHK
jgi:hypothetical protein